MPLHSLEQAQFDHVDEQGDLVFSTNSRDFTVKVDDVLERAILEARQIRSEAGDEISPNPAQSLPISSIQALIRAGVEPHAVAEKYGLGDALVRRFSSPVQTEKQYAIEQFLMVPAPRQSKTHTVEDLISGTLTRARIAMESLDWAATRRGRDPWVISATFNTARHRVRAEWAWNMHDNTVESLNKAARILLGETPEEDGSTKDERPAENNEIRAIATTAEHSAQRRSDTAGPLSQSAAEAQNMLEGANGPAPVISVALGGRQDIAQKGPAFPSRTITGAEDTDNPSTAAATPTNTNSPAAQESVFPTASTASNGHETGPSRTSAAVNNTPSALPLPSRPSEPTPEGQSAEGNGWEQMGLAAREDAATKSDEGRKAGNVAGESSDTEKRSKHKSKRSAVPSWDEILFGQ